MFNIRARQQEQDLVSMTEALGDVTRGVYFDFADRKTGYAQVKAAALGPRGVALATYDITESRALLPGAATHLQFDRPLTGRIEKRYGETCLAAGPDTSILSSPSDTEFSWRPEGRSMRCMGMSLPVTVFEEYLSQAERSWVIGRRFVTFDKELSALEAPFVDLMFYTLEHLDSLRERPKQASLAEALLLETFTNMASQAGFLAELDTAGLRSGHRSGKCDAQLVARAEGYMREHFAEALTMSEVARALGASLRKLQTVFLEHRGLSPRQCLSAIRLEEVRRRLSRESESGNVTSVAIDCGFVHLGRFSSAYLGAYGEHPSQTLARRRRRS